MADYNASLDGENMTLYFCTSARLQYTGLITARSSSINEGYRYTGISNPLLLVRQGYTGTPIKLGD